MAPVAKTKSKANAKGNKTIQSATNFSTRASEPRVNFTNERHHDDDEIIYPKKFPFAEVIPTWGPDFNPNFMNAALGKQFSKGHHAGKGGTGKKRRDFENFTLAFCLEWIHDSEGNWCRCGNQFTVDSNQCTTHPKVSHKDGPNQIYRHMKEGREGNWGMLKNRHIQPDEAPLTPAEITHKRFEDIEAEVTKRCAADGGDFGTVWVEVKAEFDRQDLVEQRAARNPSAAGNGDEQNAENINPRLSKNKPAPGIAVLEEKALRNPNRRGKTAAKGATQWNSLTTISEE
jgi:hypothetical protein